MDICGKRNTDGFPRIGKPDFFGRNVLVLDSV